MSVLRILQKKNPIDRITLDSVAIPIRTDEFHSNRIIDAIQNLEDTMRHAHGCGIAAPQIGMNRRIILVEDLAEYMDGIPEHVLAAMGRMPFARIILINPIVTIVDAEDVFLFEGCLSHSSVELGVVPRAKTIHVVAFNESGEPLSFDATGMLARIIQHEVDHLDGVCIDTKALPNTWVALDDYKAIWRGCPPDEIKRAFYRAA